jgi:polyisoprenoid-binding protein YceI
MALSIDQQQTRGTATTWRIDPATSLVEFAVRQHLPFLKQLTIIGRTVVGRFADVSGTIVLEERRPASAQATVAVGVASVDSGLPRRDDHLRSAAFFDGARHPNLTLSSRMIEEIDRAGGRYRVMADLTIRGVTRAVRLDVRLTHAQDAAGWTRVVIATETVLNRRDYGLVWNGLLLRVADDVAVTLRIEAVPADVARP